MESIVTPRSRPPLLLHICCAPCAAHVIEVLLPTYEIIGFFCNPNISPKDEFLRRLRDVCRVCARYDIPLWIPRYCHSEWTAHVHGLETEPEGGQRCTVCFKIRMEATAHQAHRAAVPCIATTLTVSPHKNADVITRIGSSVASSYGIFFLAQDFKKHDGFRKSVIKSKEMGLYRQSYCGCKYSYQRVLNRKGETQ